MIVETTDGRTADMKVPPPASGHESVFVFAIHKSGSVLLDNVVGALCAYAKFPAVSIDFFCFELGMPIELVTSDSVAPLLNSPGYCFFGLRGVHAFMAGLDLPKFRKIVLVRDPRDVLTSFYFSMAKSHAIPEEGELRGRMLATRERASASAIDDYVLSEEVDFIQDNFQKFIKLEGENTKVYRYEDIIFDKETWVRSIAQWLLLDVPDAEIARIAQENDIRPTDENPNRHIRQVTPGNFVKHLTPATVAALNERYKDVMAHYGYDM